MRCIPEEGQVILVWGLARSAFKYLFQGQRIIILKMFHRIFMFALGICVVFKRFALAKLIKAVKVRSSTAGAVIELIGFKMILGT